MGDSMTTIITGRPRVTASEVADILEQRQRPDAAKVRAMPPKKNVTAPK
jgi:hypothetical protein